MKKFSFIIALAVSTFSFTASNAQDPAFSQFFSSPLNINPALTANINSDWRIISNLRSQWIGPASPYNTGTISFDTKLNNSKYENAPESNYVGIGGMFMYDKAMGGIQKSSFASLNLSYNVKLAEDDYGNKQKLSVGFGGIYGRKNVDFSKVNFATQFDGTGFDTNLPTGETALNNMKPYASMSAGIVYSASSERSNFDFGVAAFHMNKPKQTYVQDEKQVLAVRKVVHANFETNVNEKVVFNANAIYQNQAKASYYQVGGSIGYRVDEEENGTMINAGMWYWSKNAVVPYIGLAYKDMQFGFSYDVTVSKLTEAEKKPGTFELSLILRGSRRSDGSIPCPWK